MATSFRLPSARTCAAGSVMALLVLLIPLIAANPARAGISCAPSVDTFVWDGSAGDNLWDNPNNWDTNCTPGLLGEPEDDDVTIPAGATVRILAGHSAYIAKLRNSGTLIVETGGVLKTVTDSRSRHTIMRGLLFGTGRFTVTNSMDWISTAGGAASQSTRRCAVNHDDCSSVTNSPGTTVVKVGAVMRISGKGVNLDDQRVIENHGRVILSGEGYIAADDGTSFLNQQSIGDPLPRFVLQNDRGYYQGNFRGLLGPPQFVNAGSIVKTGSTGVSVIDADYSRSGNGQIVIKSGSLNVVSPSGNFTNTARVKQGSGFGNGGPEECDAKNDPASCEVVQPTMSDKLAASINLTKQGTTSSDVTLQELPGQTTAGTRGAPVRLETPGAKATTNRPLVLRLYLDASLLGVGETPAGVANTETVERRGDGPGANYQALPSCVDEPLSISGTCVARAQSVNETSALGGGDVVFVVKTLANSRYRVSK